MTAAAAIGAAALIAAAAAACGGSGGPATPSPSPGADASPLPGTTPTPLPPLDGTSYRFLYSEFGALEDVIWSIAPGDPSDRVQVARVSHKSGWGIKPALSPDGQKIAYNAMPESGLFANTDAETYILERETGKTRLLAEGVDLRTPPRWSPDGKLLFLRRDVGEDVTVVLVDLSKLEEDGEEEPPPIRTVLKRHVSDVLAYRTVGFDPEAATLYFIQVQGGTESGTYLGRYGPATGDAVATATAVAGATATARAGTPTPSPTPTPSALPGDVFLFLTDQTAFDFSLSPDSSRLAFTVPGLVEGEFVLRTDIADVRGEQVSPLSTEGLPAGEHVSPIWHPDGDTISLGQLPAGPNPGRVALVPLAGGRVTFLAPPERGYDQPLSWSPDGKFLAVNSFRGDPLVNRGPARLVFLSPNGHRLAAPEGAEIEPIGWVEA